MAAAEPARPSRSRFQGSEFQLQPATANCSLKVWRAWCSVLAKWSAAHLRLFVPISLLLWFAFPGLCRIHGGSSLQRAMTSEPCCQGGGLAWPRLGQRAVAVSATTNIKQTIKAKAEADHGWLSGWLPVCTEMRRTSVTSQPGTNLEQTIASS